MNFLAYKISSRTKNSFFPPCEYMTIAIWYSTLSLQPDVCTKAVTDPGFYERGSNQVAHIPLGAKFMGYILRNGF